MVPIYLTPMTFLPQVLYPNQNPLSQSRRLSEQRPEKSLAMTKSTGWTLKKFMPTFHYFPKNSNISSTLYQSNPNSVHQAFSRATTFKTSIPSSHQTTHPPYPSLAVGAKTRKQAALSTVINGISVVAVLSGASKTSTSGIQLSSIKLTSSI